MVAPADGELRMSGSRLVVEWVLLLFAACAVVILALLGGWTERIDLRILDFANEMSLPDPSEDIVLVEIDDRSLAEVGAWPWPRANHARIIDAASAAGARAVVLDILFLEPSASPEDDKALVDSVARSGRSFVPFTFIDQMNVESGAIPAYPLPELQTAAKGMGHVAVFPDSDGVVRWFDLAYQLDGATYPHLTQSVANGLDAVTTTPTGQSERVLAPVHPRGSYQTIAASDIIQGNLPAEFLQNKILLVGATAQGLGDRYAVPAYAGRIMSGVELQANLLDAVLTQNLVRPTQPLWTAMILVAFTILLFVGFWYFAPRHMLVFVASLVAALLILSVASIALFQLWLPVAPALLVFIFAYPFWGWRRLSWVNRQIEREARHLGPASSKEEEDDIAGFDSVARHLARLKSITGQIKADWTFLRAVINASPDPMLVFDTHGRNVLMNERAMQLFPGSDPEEGLTFQEIVADARGQVSTDEAGEVLAFDGGQSFLLARGGIDESLASQIVDLRDVSALRAAEQQRQEMLEFLSHDMRSPQVAIIGLAGMQEGGEPDRFKRIEAEARRTLKLAEDFVQIARLESAGLEMEDIDVGSLLHEVVDRAYPVAKSRGICIEADVPDDPIFAMVDGMALSRAVDNLVGNALKFSPSESTVSVELVQPDPAHFVIHVNDQGPGLPEERMEDPFARFGAHDEKAGPSAGLGLAYVEKVVTGHGGTITVDSETGVGTRFTLTLPMEEQPVA